MDAESSEVQSEKVITDDDNTPKTMTTTTIPTATTTASQLMSPRPKHSISESSSLSDSGNDTNAETDDSNDEAKKSDEESNESAEKSDYYSIEEQRKMIEKLCIVLNGRNILDLGANLRSQQPGQSASFIQSAELPENNLNMFLANRSQYHRLGANGHIQEYALAKCTCCDLIYPTTGYNNNNIYNNANINTMTQEVRAAEGKNSLAAGVLAYLNSSTAVAYGVETTTNTGFRVNSNNNEYNCYHGSSATPTNNSFNSGYGHGFGNAATAKYNNNNYSQQTAMVNALLNMKEPNFINNNTINNLNNTNNVNNINNITALNRIWNGGNVAQKPAAATNNAGAFNNNNNVSVNGKSGIESLAAALLSQNIFNAAAASNTYHSLHNQFNHNQHHKMSPPQNNYGYYKQF